MRKNTFLRLASASLLVTVACSSSSSNGTSPGDAGTPVPSDAGLDASVADAAPPPVQEPPWSGTTVEPGCKVNGCIHAFTYVTAYGQGILSGDAAPGNPVLNGISQYTITYVSNGAEITGSVFVPDSTPPAGGFGVVVMNQFTSGVAPSCAPSAGELAIGVASTSALNGFLTLVPDATSYGVAPYGGYMEATIAGHAALDGVRAAFHTSQALNLPVARKAVVAGLSQGAFSTMAAATAYPVYANELEVRGFAAAEPPSNLRTGTNADFTGTTANVVYDAMRLWSWQGLLKLSGGQIFQPPYDTEAPHWFQTECIYNGTDGSSGTLYNEFLEPAAEDGGTPTVPIAGSTVLSPTFLGYVQNNSWPADWAAEFTASTNVPAGLKLPVLIFEGSADVTVYPATVDTYVSQLQAAGVSVDYRKIPGGTHGTTALSSFTVTQAANDQAIAWITKILGN